MTTHVHTRVHILQTHTCTNTHIKYSGQDTGQGDLRHWEGNTGEEKGVAAVGKEEKGVTSLGSLWSLGQHLRMHC